MNCSEFKKILNEYIDGELSVNEKKKADEHIAECTQCRKNVLLYRKLSEKVKECNDVKMPDDFKVELPKKKNAVITLFRKHETVVATLVAAAALVIFAGGIDSTLYQTPTENIPKETAQAKFSAIEKGGNEETEKAETNEDKKEYNRTGKAAEKVQDVNESSKENIDYDMIESMPAPVQENLPEGETENAVNDALDITAQTTEESGEAQETDTAEAADMVNDAPTNMKMMSPDAPQKAAASGGGSSAAAYDGRREEISSYTPPSVDKFESSEEYNNFVAKLSDIKARAQSCTDEELVQVYAEFSALISNMN